MKWFVFSTIWSISLSIGSMPVSAQAPFIHFHHLTIADGLSNNRVNDIYQDSEGFIWFATDEGLDRFDGNHFVVYRHNPSDPYSLAGNTVKSVTGDIHGNIWVSTGYGISSLNLFSGKFDNYYLYSDNKPEFTTGISRITSLPSGTIIGLTGYPGGPPPELYRVDVKRHQLIHIELSLQEPFIKKQFANSIALQKNGWIICQSDSYLFISKDGGMSFHLIDPDHPIPAGNNANHFFLVYADSNTCWLNNGTKGRISQLLVYHYRTKSWRKYIIPYHMMLRQGIHYGSNNYWFSGYTSGLLKLDTVTGKYTRFFHSDNDPGSISDNSIYGSYADGHGTLWLATEGGVDYWNEKEDKIGYINNRVSGFERFGGPSWGSIAEDADGRIWLGTVDYNSRQNGLFSLDPLTMKFHKYTRHKKRGKDNIPIWNILPLPHGKLLVSTQWGLYEFNSLKGSFSKKLFLSLPAGLTKFQTGFTIMKKDIMDNIWFGLWKKGLIVYNLKTHQSVRYDTGASFLAHRLPDDNVGNATIDDDHHILWVVYRDKNILTGIDIRTNKIIHEYNIDKKGLHLLNGIACICYGPSQKIWIGTIGQGLICFDPVAKKIVKIYTFSDGLASEIIYSLCVDKKDRLWIYTGNGIQCLDQAIGVFYTINTDLMPPPGSIEGAPMIVTHDGTLFAGYGKNLLYFNPDEVLFSVKVDPPKLLSLQKMGNESFLSPGTKVIHIYHKESYFRITFASLNMLRSRMFRYSYRLLGYNNYWINCGNEGRATFSHLPPGKYSLQMRTIVSGIPWDRQYTSLAIVVVPVFYQTAWFQLILLVVLMSLITYVIWRISTRKYRIQVLSMRRQQQITGIRNRIAQDIHDDIGSGLTRISIQSELIMRKAVSEKDDYRKILGSISKQAQELTRSLGEIVWTINPMNDHVDTMLGYFKEYVHHFLEDSDLHYKIHFPETEDSRFLHPDIKRNLLLILKEALNNTVKHAHAKMIWITFSYLGVDGYVMTIKDDGIFRAETDVFRKGGNGLHNMKSRADRIRAIFSTIHNPEVGGTEIKIQGTFYR